jgi:hypothetical protein
MVAEVLDTETLDAQQLFSLLLVGALWGCTNAFLRQDAPAAPARSAGRPGGECERGRRRRTARAERQAAARSGVPGGQQAGRPLGWKTGTQGQAKKEGRLTFAGRCISSSLLLLLLLLLLFLFLLLLLLLLLLLRLLLVAVAATRALAAAAGALRGGLTGTLQEGALLFLNWRVSAGALAQIVCSLPICLGCTVTDCCMACSVCASVHPQPGRLGALLHAAGAGKAVAGGANLQRELAGVHDTDRDAGARRAHARPVARGVRDRLRHTRRHANELHLRVGAAAEN